MMPTGPAGLGIATRGNIWRASGLQATWTMHYAWSPLPPPGGDAGDRGGETGLIMA